MQRILPALVLLLLGATDARAGKHWTLKPTTLRDEADRSKFVVVGQFQSPQGKPDEGTTDFVVMRVVGAAPGVTVPAVIRLNRFLKIDEPKNPPKYLAFGGFSNDGKADIRSEEHTPE